MRALIAANGFMTVSQPNETSIVAKIERGAIMIDATQAISEMATYIHLIVMTADREGAESVFEELMAVDDKWLRSREIAVMELEGEMPTVYVQANTRLEANGSVIVVEYDATVEGVVQRWMERDVGQENEEQRDESVSNIFKA
jgi:hypothetical protein